jgi:carboxypeptidase family protein/TonB-dependent receptor-like protein
MKRTFVFVLSALLILDLTCAMLWAQATAQISGTAKDQSGAVLPGVEVTVTQTETGVARSAVTNETGSYVLTNLPLGPYRLEAGLPGFRTFVQTGIVLQVNSSPAINPVLEVGQVSEQVEVKSDATLVETRTVGVGQVVENARILDLPLNGRQVTDLISLAGGATPTTLAAASTASGRNAYANATVSVAGGINSTLNYTLDGANHNDPMEGTYMSLPFPDALQEFKLETSATSAQAGVRPSGSVTMVTKSGTNEFHGNLFEFVRNGSFNARNAFATKRDSLKRNQFGGTVGGPIQKNKMFFFAGFQGGTIRTDPPNSIAYVPTPAMLAGDFSTITSAGCNAGRAISLRAPFVNNRIDPALFSKAALALTSKLPATADACGKVIFGSPNFENRQMAVGKVDYQLNNNHSVFGRYIQEHIYQPLPYAINHNLLSASTALDGQSEALALGDTYLFGANIVNSLRLSADHYTAGYTDYDHTYGWPDFGVKMYPYIKDSFYMSVTGGFTAGTRGGPTKAATFGLNDDLSVIRGSHQLGFGANTSLWWTNSYSDFYAIGRATVNGQVYGLGLADYLMGNVTQWTGGTSAPGNKRSTYIGVYGADTWKLNQKVTLNYGLRWEPFFPMINRDNSSVHFDINAMRNGIKSTHFLNAPAGLSYPDDPGFPGQQGMYNKWANFSPRVGLAWDVSGDGRTSVRASVGTFYDYPNMYYQVGLSNAPPVSARIVVNDVRLDSPWANYPGGDPFPIDHGPRVGPNVPFQLYNIVTAMDYDSPNTTVTHWNLSVQKQIGTDWLVSANYLGNQTTHLWGTQALNPGVYLGTGPCTLNGVQYATCSTTTNLDQRRRFMLDSSIPKTTAQYYGYVNKIDTGGTASYNGLVLSVQRRAARGVTVNANYTWSHCITDWWNSTANSGNATAVYSNPDNRHFDRGNCISGSADRRHVFNLSAVAETPRFSNSTLRVVASGWRFSPIVKFLSGDYMSITTSTDVALTGIDSQRVNQILENPYGDKTVSNYLNPAAFLRPATGTLGNSGRGSIHGPGTSQIDLAVSRTFQFRESQKIEFRAESFNLPNSFHMNDPTTNINSNTFGQITSARDPRIMQLALKYFF